MPLLLRGQLNDFGCTLVVQSSIFAGDFKLCFGGFIFLRDMRRYEFENKTTRNDVSERSAVSPDHNDGQPTRI